MRGSLDQCADATGTRRPVPVLKRAQALASEDPAPLQAVTVVGRGKAQIRPFGDDPRGINRTVAGVVMTFDVSKVHGLTDTGPLIQLT